MLAFPSRRSRGFDPHFELRRAKSGISWVLLGDSAFLWSGDGYVGGFWGFIKGVMFPFYFQEGTWDFLGNTAA